MIRRVRSALLCDDVRTEDTNKGLLIGVYGRQVVARQRPAMLSLMLQLALDVDSDKNEVEIRLRALTERTTNLTLNAKGGYCTLTMALDVALTDTRLLRIDIRNPGGEWLECGEWDLGFSDDSEEAPEEIAEQIRELNRQMSTD